MQEKISNKYLTYVDKLLLLIVIDAIAKIIQVYIYNSRCRLVHGSGEMSLGINGAPRPA